MSDLYANITETVQHDPDRPGVHTTVYADLHTGDPAVMAATLRGVADSLDPGDPVEAEEWADRQADERAARDAALVAPWREAFRALSGVIPDRYAAGLRSRHVCDEKRGALIIGAGDTDRCGCWIVGTGTLTARRLEPAGRTDALDGPEPRPSPRHVKAILDDLKPVAESVPVDVLDLVRQHAIMHTACVDLTNAGAEEPAKQHHKQEVALFARIEAEVQRLRTDADKDAMLIQALGKRGAEALAEVERLKAANELLEAQRLDAWAHVHALDTAAPPQDGPTVLALPPVPDPPTERTYTIQLNRAQNIELLTWLSTNAHGGSISIGRRLTIDVVEGGGLLVHARPYRFDDRAAEDAERSERCTQCGKLFTERACGPTHALLTTLQADAQAACLRVVEAARAWEARIKSDPNNWADDEDFALIKAVDALSEYATLRPDILYATRQAGWRDGVRWAAAEADAMAAQWEADHRKIYVADTTNHLRVCADDPDRPTLVGRDQAPETRP